MNEIPVPVTRVQASKMEGQGGEGGQSSASDRPEAETQIFYESVEEIPASGFNVAEVVAATLRAAERARKPELFLKDIATLIPPFAGSIEDDVKVWLGRIESIQRSYNVNPNLLLLAIVAKLEGRALKWFHSRPEHVELGLDDFKDRVDRCLLAKKIR